MSNTTFEIEVSIVIKGTDVAIGKCLVDTDQDAVLDAASRYLMDEDAGVKVLKDIVSDWIEEYVAMDFLVETEEVISKADTEEFKAFYLSALND